MKRRRDAISGEALELVAGRFRILGEPMRLRILHALRAGERSVRELMGETGAGQANTSKHLNLMLEAGVVARRRAGLEARYRIADPSVLRLCDIVCSGLSRRLASQQQSVRSFGRR
ncbi:MAG: winged helix-turn-helix transcriptional regulator [Acidobacteria bacterium]|nr:winged helix-turn-helix transcriptional regulator [Acidobacteriota bacterium]